MTPTSLTPQEQEAIQREAENEYWFECKNAFGVWKCEQSKIKDQRCKWDCNCQGKGIKTKKR